MKTNVRDSIIVATALAFFVTTMPGCHEEAIVVETPISQVGETQQAAATPPRPRPRPRPRPPKPKPAKPKPKGPAKKKQGKKKNVPKKGKKKAAPKAKAKPKKDGAKKTVWTRRQIKALIKDIGIIGTMIIGVVAVWIYAIIEIWDRIVNGNRPPAPAPAPAPGPKPKVKPVGAAPAGMMGLLPEGMVEVTCVAIAEDTLECTYYLDGPCDPATLGAGETCVDPVEVCEAADGDGCDPAFEECCGDDAGSYCQADDTLAECAPGDTCCSDSVVEACSADELVDVGDPQACDGPTVDVEVCEADSPDDECLEMLDGTSIGDGSCCGPEIGEVSACVCAIDYCDQTDPTLCAEVELPGSEHVCGDASFCDAFTDTTTLPDTCDCVVDDVDDAGNPVEVLIPGSEHECANAGFCEVYETPESPECVCVMVTCDAVGCSESDIAGSDHLCGDHDFCDGYAGPTPTPATSAEASP